MAKWTAYRLNPIDFRWDYLPTAQEVAAKIAASEVGSYLHDPHSPEVSIAEYVGDLQQALTLARDEGGWDGDFRAGNEPRVLWLPDELAFRYAFVWKQEDDGTTFVVSPVALPWLDPS